jgi:hypothetical protein
MIEISDRRHHGVRLLPARDAFASDQAVRLMMPG